MTFKPEIGKRHVMRNGEITDVIKQDEWSGMLYTGVEFRPSNSWFSTGAWLAKGSNERDLVAVDEEPVYYWVNMYPTFNGWLYKDKKLALADLDVGHGKTLKLKVVQEDDE